LYRILFVFIFALLCFCVANELSVNKDLYNFKLVVAFSALTLLVGQQEVHPACKN